MKNLNQIQNLIVDRVWGKETQADFSARDVFKASFLRIHNQELKNDIIKLSTQPTIREEEITPFIQKFLREIEAFQTSSIQQFNDYFYRYSGREAVIVMCLFGPGSLSPMLQNKVQRMYECYVREQRTDWGTMHGSIIGHADIYSGWEALEWFLSGVVLTGALWDITKKTVADLLKQAKNMAGNFNGRYLGESEKRISLLDLSNEEIEELSVHWQANFNQFFLNFGASERAYINMLSEKYIIMPFDSGNEQNNLTKLGYLCTLEINPQEISVALFPKWVRFFQ